MHVEKYAEYAEYTEYAEYAEYLFTFSQGIIEKKVTNRE